MSEQFLCDLLRRKFSEEIAARISQEKLLLSLLKKSFHFTACIFQEKLLHELKESRPVLNFHNDQAYSRPRGWCLSASWATNWGNPWTPEYHRQLGTQGFKGAPKLGRYVGQNLPSGTSVVSFSEGLSRPVSPTKSSSLMIFHTACFINENGSRCKAPRTSAPRWKATGLKPKLT